MQQSDWLIGIVVAGLSLAAGLATAHAPCDWRYSCAREHEKQDGMANAAVRKRLALDATRAGDAARLIAAPIPRVSAELYRKLEVLAAVFEHVRAAHVDQPHEGRLIEGAIGGIIRQRKGSAAGEDLVHELARLEGMPAGDGHAADRALHILGRAIAAVRTGDGGAAAEDELIAAAIRGMLTAHEPDAIYYDPERWRRMQWH